MAVQNGLNPAAVPVTTMMNYVQTFDTVQELAQDAQDDAGRDPWWSEG